MDRARELSKQLEESDDFASREATRRMRELAAAEERGVLLLRARARQGSEVAPGAWFQIRPKFAEGLLGIKQGLEAIDGTPVIDIEPALGRRKDP